MSTKPVYKNPTPGQPLITSISTGCKTPLLEIKYCNIVNPFYYSNSQIPRYSVTCLVDPLEHKEFIKAIQTIEKNEKVETIIKNDHIKEGGEHLTTGKLLVKFQTKDKIPVYLHRPGNQIESLQKGDLMELEDELARGEKIMVIYDILRYTKKNTMTTEHGINFKPSAVFYFPSENSQQEGV